MEKGKATFLLKRNAKFVTQRKKPMEYPLSVESTMKRKGERKEHENMS